MPRHVEREEARESFRQEALASWCNYCATGLHVSGDEVFDWLKTWGTGTEMPAPTCHD